MRTAIAPLAGLEARQRKAQQCELQRKQQYRRCCIANRRTSDLTIIAFVPRTISVFAISRPIK